MRASLSNEKWRQFEEIINVVDIRMHMQEFYGDKTHTMMHTNFKKLMTTCMQDGDPTHEHGMHVIELIDKVVGLKLIIPNELHEDIILLSISYSFNGFMVNFDMNNKRPALKR
ncbi:uncharacterized protein [Primulina huaijiensis]|uniref:uncharacterized protein n=1 Tax=Primulina huaijiensis TaxID=1492673 RepID=UPI003CC726C3